MAPGVACSFSPSLLLWAALRREIGAALVKLGGGDALAGSLEGGEADGVEEEFPGVLLL